jgi:hypothetical protein
MPVKVTNLPPELGLTPEWVAGVARDLIEQSISNSTVLTPVARAALDAPNSGPPAQFLLTTTLDGVHIGTTINESASANPAAKQGMAPRVYTTWLTIGLMWRALDPSTGSIIAIGPASASGSADEKQMLAEAAANTVSDASNSSMYAGLAKRVLAKLVQEQVSEMKLELASVPFQAKVAAVKEDGVVLDCGADVGLAAGDSFGIRNTSGPPVGLIRVSEVDKSTAYGQVLQKVGPIAPGDQLEWVGTYTVTR